MVSTRVNYELPYPGMLPDNPLYVLKVIRDGIVKFLINDPMQKARFSILNADKRIYAGKMLVDHGKDQLAVETITKSNNYFDDALAAIKTAKSKNPKSTDINPLLDQFKTSIQKHEELIEGIKESIDQVFVERLSVQQKRLKNTEKTVRNLLQQK
jgi:hypothetical protein